MLCCDFSCNDLSSNHSERRLEETEYLCYSSHSDKLMLCFSAAHWDSNTLPDSGFNFISSVTHSVMDLWGCKCWTSVCPAKKWYSRGSFLLCFRNSYQSLTPVFSDLNTLNLSADCSDPDLCSTSAPWHYCLLWLWVERRKNLAQTSDLKPEQTMEHGST